MILLYLGIFCLLIWITIKLVVYYHMEYIFPVNKIDNDKEKVLIVGDSVAFGMFLANRKRRRYSRLLQKSLDNTQVTNLGVNGAVVKEGWPRTYMNHEYLKIIKENTFDTIIIHIGSNDTKDGYWVDEKVFKKDFIKLLEKLRTYNPSAKIIIVSITPVYSVLNRKEPFYGIKEENISAVNGVLKEVSELYKLEYVDIYSLFMGNKSYFADGVHPNKKGHQVIFDAIIEKLKDVD